MKHFVLTPINGWNNWSHNADLSDLIYDFGMKKVNSGLWFYINPGAGYGIFEGEAGNYLALETRDLGERNIILSMHCGLNDDADNIIVRFIEKLIEDYNLEKSIKG